MKNPLLKTIPNSFPLWLGSALILTGLPTLAHSWGVTEIRGGEHEWTNAPWSAGEPGPKDTVYIQSGSKVTLGGQDLYRAYGVRLGDSTGGMAAMQIEGAALETCYVVVADAANANANFVQAGGNLIVKDSEALDFEIGNPANTPIEPSVVIATFAAGKARLADFRVNLREQRKSRVAFFGVLYDVSAKSLQFDTAGQDGWQEAELQFVLSDAGIAPLRIEGTADLGPEDRVSLILDGSRYAGKAATFTLLEAEELRGGPSKIQLGGFKRKAEVKRDDNRLVLILK
jgi:hypothetical protein